MGIETRKMMLKALEDFNEWCIKNDVRPFKVQILQDFAYVEDKIQSKNYDEKFLSNLNSILMEISARYGLDSNWLIINENPLSFLNYLTGDLHFKTIANFEAMDVQALTDESQLQLNVSFLDNFLAKTDENIESYSSVQCLLGEIKELMTALGIRMDALIALTEGIVFCSKTYSLIEKFCAMKG